MSQRVEFVFFETSGDPARATEKFRLGFELLDTDFSRRWLAALLDVIEKPDPIVWNNSGSLFVDEQQQRAAIERMTEDVRDVTGTIVRTEPLRAFSTATDLAPIREKCLAIVRAHSLDSLEHIETRGSASRVVNAIASYESLYAPDHHFHGDFSFKTETRYFLAASDFERFTPDRNDGWLYLDYAQAGLTPIAGYRQKSDVRPTAQVSFNPTAQIVFRDTFAYEDEEKQEMRTWIARALKKRRSSKKLSIGQIPLGKPIHRFDRDQVLAKLLSFQGSVEIEAYEGGERLTANTPAVVADFQRLKPFHPYGASPLGDLINACVLFGRRLVALWGQIVALWGQRWRLLIPFHVARPYAWALWFKVTWPVRKLYYFSRHAHRHALSLFQTTWHRHVSTPFHRMRPTLWKVWFRATWPVRKLYYFSRHAHRHALSLVQTIWHRYVSAPFHRMRPTLWKYWFRVTWPVRKLYYFSRHAHRHALSLVQTVWHRLVSEPFHRARPSLAKFWFRLTWPVRKSAYFAKHIYRKYILR